MEKKIKVAVLGATGRVGREFLQRLSDHPWFEVVIVAASPRSAGKILGNEFNLKANNLKDNKYIKAYEMISNEISAISKEIKEMTIYDANNVHEIAAKVDLVFSALDMEKNQIIALEEAYAKKEVIVVSNNSACRDIYDVPMIVPEINHDHLDILPFQKERLGTKKGFIVVKPNCAAQSFMHILDALKKNKAFEDEFADIYALLLQSISGSGRYLEEDKDIQANLLPLDNEAKKSIEEPTKIFGKIYPKEKFICTNDEISIRANSFRVPVENGHTADMTIRFKDNSKYIDPDGNILIYKIVESLKKYKPLKKLKLPSSPKKIILVENEYNLHENVNNGNGMSITMFDLKIDDRRKTINFKSLVNNIARGAAGGAVLTAELLVAKDLV